MNKKTLTDLCLGYPTYAIGEEKDGENKTEIPSISVRSLVYYISNGNTKSYPKLSDNQRNLLKGFLNRIRAAFGPRVAFKNGKLTFKNVTKEEFLQTKVTRYGWGRGHHNQSSEAIKDGIRRILEYVIEKDVSRIPMDTLNLVTMGINVAKLRSDKVQYSDEPYQDFKRLFLELGLDAEVTEINPKNVQKKVDNRNKLYRRDWSPYRTTFLTIKYDNIQEVKEAVDKLRKKKMMGGFFKKDIPYHKDLRVTTRLTGEQLKMLENLTDELSSNKKLLRRFVKNSIIERKTLENMSILLEEKDIQILDLRNSVKQLEDELTNFNG